MTRPLVTNDWLAFDRYSYRIHEIICLFATSIRGVPNIDNHIFLILHQYRPHTPLFPSLRFLKMPKHLVESVSQKQLAVMPLMISTLRTMGLTALNPATGKYLEQLSSLGSRLRRIRIFGRHSAAFTSALTRFNHLEYLDMNFHWVAHYLEIHPEYPGYPAFLNHLSTLDYLSSLLISPPLSLDTALLSRSGFRQLKRLAVTGDIRTFTLLCGMALCIEYLVLEMCVPEDHLTWQPFFKALPRSCPFLKEIRIYGRYTIGEKPMAVLKHLEPIFDLPLKGLSLKSDQPIEVGLSDADVDKITGFWPDLSNLEIFADGRYTAPNIPSASGVRSALKNCDGLQYLRMSCGNRTVKLSTVRGRRTTFTLDNIYPPFVKFN